MPPHGSASHEGAEKAVTGAAAAKAQAAAVKAAGGGKAGAVTTDFTGHGYEVTVTKSDGSTTEIHLDSSFNAVQSGHGGGNCPGGRMGPPGGSSSGSSSGSGSGSSGTADSSGSGSET
jgi:hypothetical protein